MDRVDRITELFIFDIYIAILKIEKIVSEFDSAQDLLHDFRSWDSVIREFEIIGEASKYLLKAKLLDPGHRQVVDFRNKITHEYFGIDAEEIWDISFHDLSEYKKIVLERLNEIEPSLRCQLAKTFQRDNHYLDFVVEALEELMA